MSDATLLDRLNAAANPAEDGLEVFLEWSGDQGIELYPAQEEAVLELFEGHHVLLKTPTGSGKSLVALALHLRSMSLGQRSVYTAPIKALVSEKFRSLCGTFGAENVGLMTGDGAVNRDAPILCCTAEVLAKLALRYGDETPYHAVIMDEFHYYGDRDRGMAWQLPLLTMPHAQFLLLSATLGDTTAIEADLAARTGAPVVAVDSAERPVPLDFKYAEQSVDLTLGSLVRGGKAPVYAVHFTQREAAELAQALTSTTVADADQKTKIKAALKGTRFDSPYGPTLRKYLSQGIGLHHAGLLPRYRMVVESMAQQGLFSVICGTDTLGVGINVPIRSVLFTKLCKFDGEQTVILPVRDFKQIAGRAGRRGYDTEGTVVAQPPEWVLENQKLSALIAAGKKKKNKVVRKKAPTKGYKHWDAQTFERLVDGEPEALDSRFTIDHSLVLQMLQKAEETLEDPLEALDALIEASHTGQRAKERLRTQVTERMAQLMGAGVVTDGGPDALPRYRLREGLQQQFSLHHSLSLFLLYALEQLDPAHPEYALDVVSLVEAIVEHPRVILRAQQHRDRGRKVAALKAEGVPYEERQAIIEDISYPKPKGEWIYAHFNAYREAHPWLSDAAIRPKGVARELAEVLSPFNAWVKGLELSRSEGVVLRYLTQVYKTLIQSVPQVFRTPELDDVIGYFRALLARVDDSLLTSWQALRDDAPAEDVSAKPIDISADVRAFRARIRHELYALVRALSRVDFDEAIASIKPSEGWDAKAIERAIQPYRDERGEVCFDGRFKQGWTTRIDADGPHQWTVSQVLVDDETDVPDDEDAGDTWVISGRVDLRDNTNPSGPVVELVAIAPL